MMYQSTRGQTEPMGFQDAVLTGLAPDGGLLIPSSIPQVQDRLRHWKTLSYQEITYEILRLYVDVPDHDLLDLISRSYARFRHPEIAPAVPLGAIHLLELFHGPTLAFKDIALQFLSHFFAYALEQRERTMNVVGATSGDTGSAAIHGVRGQDRINIFMMHPHQRVAPLQELQMTSVLDKNVFNIALEGTFDDCQNIMKATFQDLDFKAKYSLGAVNSVNWARVLAQIVYYFSAGLYIMDQKNSDRVSFAIPTGNFGDILAGYYAASMGLPISRLVLATNENNILARFFNSGTYRMSEVVPTLSPSMDIQIASNFERYLFYKLGEDGDRLRDMMASFSEHQVLTIPLQDNGNVDDLFCAGVGTTEQTLETIRTYHEVTGYVLDPHTAVGVSVAERFLEDDVPMICLATAHPAKFNAAITKAIGEPIKHEILEALQGASTRCKTLPNDERSVRDYIAKHALV